jgi:hypothetical protein
VEPRFDSRFIKVVKAMVFPKLTARPFFLQNIPDVQLADPGIGNPGQIDLIFGIADYAASVENDLIRIGDVVFLKTKFGYIVMKSDDQNVLVG